MEEGTEKIYVPVFKVHCWYIAFILTYLIHCFFSCVASAGRTCVHAIKTATSKAKLKKTLLLSDEKEATTYEHTTDSLDFDRIMDIIGWEAAFSPNADDQLVCNAAVCFPLWYLFLLCLGSTVFNFFHEMFSYASDEDKENMPEVRTEASTAVRITSDAITITCDTITWDALSFSIVTVITMHPIS